MGRFSWGYTGSIMDQLAGYYKFVPFDGQLDLDKGEILLRTTWENPPAHTCICSTPGRVLEASDDFDGRPGDSSGWEVCERDIHHNSWEWVGIPVGLSEEAIDAGIAWGRNYVNDDSHGYSQGNDRMGEQCDCSSLVLMIVGVMIDAQEGLPVEQAPSVDYDGGWQAERAEWQGDVIGREDTTGCHDDYAGVLGKPILYIAIDGVGEYQVSDIHHDAFWPMIDHYDLSDEEHGYAGDNQPIDKLRIKDPTVYYQLHELGKPLDEWHEVMHGLVDSSKYGDDFAGESNVKHDLVRIWRDEGQPQPRYNVYS
ncbi:MAG: hypothetical protein IJ111_07790 [Eggerthellaceae bacterium]|nr:hypothetical protein [Eggerthellaceae bacterium]